MLGNPSVRGVHIVHGLRKMWRSVWSEGALFARRWTLGRPLAGCMDLRSGRRSVPCLGQLGVRVCSSVCFPALPPVSQPRNAEGPSRSHWPKLAVCSHILLVDLGLRNAEGPSRSHWPKLAVCSHILLVDLGLHNAEGPRTVCQTELRSCVKREAGRALVSYPISSSTVPNKTVVSVDVSTRKELHGQSSAELCDSRVGRLGLPVPTEQSVG